MFDFRDDLQAWCETPGWILDLDINAFVTFSVNGFDWRLFAPFWSLTLYHYINEDDCLIISQKWVCNPIISKILIWNELQAEPFWVCLVQHLSKKYKKYIIKDFICLHKKTFDIENKICCNDLDFKSRVKELFSCLTYAYWNGVHGDKPPFSTCLYTDTDIILM